MKNKLLLIFTFLLALGSGAGAQETFNIEIEALNIPNAPGLHSFVSAHHDGKWLLLGGRTDGLHQRQPFAAFQPNDNNTSIFVIDPATGQVWSASLSSLTSTFQEQLQSTNMQFEQTDTVLYITGGYGYSPTAGDHVTHDYLTAANIPGLMQAIIQNLPLQPHFRQLKDSRFQVTGGYLDELNGTYYLVGGQDFEGRYNPMGPNHGPGFYQQYTDEIRKFEIVDNGSSLSIQNYSALHDSSHLHRRDYNLVPQVFPNGDRGFTAFTGVFQHAADLPWLNTVDILPGGFAVNNNFNQYLSQYHSAKMPVWDSANAVMHTVFFGGMSQYTLDTTTGSLVEDADVPFVKTVSRVSRWADGSMDEFKLPFEMPGFLGSGAEFLPANSAPADAMEIIHLNQIPPQSKTLLGYIYGGIESTAENIFFINTGAQSDASSKVFKVYLTKTSGTARTEAELPNDAIGMHIYPNPSGDFFGIELESRFTGIIDLHLLNAEGRKIDTIYQGEIGPGPLLFKLPGHELAPGLYFVQLKAGNFLRTQKILKH